MLKVMNEKNLLRAYLLSISMMLSKFTEEELIAPDIVLCGSVEQWGQSHLPQALNGCKLTPIQGFGVLYNCDQRALPFTDATRLSVLIKWFFNCCWVMILQCLNEMTFSFIATFENWFHRTSFCASARVINYKIEEKNLPATKSNKKPN